MSITKQLHTLSQDLKEISQVAEGERLYVSFKGSLGRYSAPDSYKKGPLQIQKIVTFVRKVFQALSRLFQRQNEGKSLKLSASRVTSLKEIINGSKNKNISLQSLTELKNSLTGLQKAFEVYKKTIDAGGPWLRQPKAKDKEAWKTEVDRQRQEIEELVPTLENLIETRNQETKERDIKGVKKFIDNPNVEIEPLKRAQTTFKRDRVVEGFKETFGEKAVTRVLEFYKLSKKEFLTSDEMYAVLAGCKANITSEDVEGLSSLEVYEKLIKMRSFEPVPTIVKQEPYKAQLERDLEILKELNRWSLYKDKDGLLGKYRGIEFFARHVIYGLCLNVKEEAQFPDKILVPGRNKAGEAICFETKMLSAKDGVMAACFVPFREAKPDCVHVVFRGLNCYDSAKRCFGLKDRDKGGISDAVGENTYREREGVILERLREYLNPDIELKIAGHSLGGVDAQRLTLSLATGKGSLGQKVSLCTFNSPGVNRQDAKAYSDLYDKLETESFDMIKEDAKADTQLEVKASDVKVESQLETKSFDAPEGDLVKIKVSNDKPSLRFKITHFLVEGDILQDPGQVRLGIDVKNPKEVKAYIFKHEYDIEEERWTYQIYYDAHCLPLSLIDQMMGKFKTKLDQVLRGEEAWPKLVTGLGKK